MIQVNEILLLVKRRGHPEVPLEAAREIELIGISDRLGDLVDGQRPVIEQFNRLFHADVIDELDGGDPDLLLEKTREIGGRKPESFRDRLDR